VIGLAVLVEASFRVLVPLSAGYLIDKTLIAHDWDRLMLTAEVLCGGFLVALVAGMVRDRVYSRLQGRSLANLRQNMYERLQQLSLTFHSQADTNDILDRFSEDISLIEHAFAMTVSWGILPGLEAALCSALMCWLDWRVGVMGLLFWPWVLLAPRTVARHANAAIENCKDEEIRILGVVEESLTARYVIRAFSLERMGISLFRKRNELLMHGETKAGLYAGAMERLSSVGVLGLQVGVLLFSGWLAFNYGLSPGLVISLQLLAIALGVSLTTCTEYFPALEESKDAWSRIQEDLADPAPVLDQSGARALPPLQNEILFFEVKYNYPEERTALAGVTVQIPRGTSAALVGPSGCGKSTMLRLLLRFNDPESGVVSIDGNDVKLVTQASLRSRVGVVLHENFVFNASIGENIRLGRPETSEETIGDVAHAAGILQFAAALPKGLETQVGANGMRLDGEAVQRLALARALLRNPDILLLDEVASALDATQEEAVNVTLREIAKDRTVIAATHRLASVSFCDTIFVFDEGRVVEQGSHAELMAKEGFYARLWRKQSGFHFSPDGRHVDVDAARLRQFPILERLPEEVLAELAPYFATETFEPNRDIVTQNDPGDKFYIVARGTLEVWRTDEQSDVASKIAVLQDGDFFGEITLITGFPRTATVCTKTVCTCISLERGQFDRVIDRFPELRPELSEVAVQRLRESGRALPVRVG